MSLQTSLKTFLLPILAVLVGRGSSLGGWEGRGPLVRLPLRPVGTPPRVKGCRTPVGEWGVLTLLTSLRALSGVSFLRLPARRVIRPGAKRRHTTPAGVEGEFSQIPDDRTLNGRDRHRSRCCVHVGAD